ncbi:MAG TPA: autotransporter-associated beta strand repeat-containing protein, partial [Humisphaera sp.]
SANTFAGAIGDGAGGATSLTKTGIGLWVLSGNNTYTGTTTLTQGVLRIGASNGLGAGGAFSVTGNNSPVLELRSDSVISLAGESMTNNNSTGTFAILVDRAIGGTGTNRTMTFGAVAQANNGAGITVVGAHGYAFSTGVNTVKGGIGVTLTNDLGSPGFVAPGFVNGVLTIAGLTTDATAGTATQTLAGWGDFVVGPVSSASAGTTLNVTKSGLGVLTFSGSNAGWTSTAQGVLSLTGGTTRLTGASPVGGASLSLNGSLLELRNDADTNLATGVALPGSASLALTHTAGGTASNVMTTLGSLSATAASVTLSVVGDRGYGLTVGPTTVGGTRTLTVNNFLAAPAYAAAGYTPGTFTFGAVTTDATAGTATLTLGGVGDYAMAGPVSSATALLAVNKTSAGLLTFGGNNGGWAANAASVLTLGGGTTRFTAAAPVGGATLSLNGGLLELRSNASVNYATNVSSNPTDSTIHVDQAVAGGGSPMTATIGTINATATKNLFVIGDRGNSLTTGVVTVASGVTFTIVNDLAAPGYAAAGYAPGTLTLGGVTNASGTTATFALAGLGDVAPFDGVVANTGGGTLNLTKGNLGLATFTGANAGWTGGLLSTTAGTTRVVATDPTVIGAANLSVAGGMTEVRSNASLAYGAKSLTLQTASGTLVAAPLIGSGNTGNTLTLGSLTSATTGLTLTLDTNHAYGVTFSGAATTALANTTVNNVGNAPVTLAGGLTSTAAAVWALGGPGDFVTTGNITGTTTALTKSGQGTLTIGGTANTYAGNIIANSGIIRVSEASAFGGAVAGTLTFLGNQAGAMGVALDLRNNGSMNLSGRSLVRTYNTVFNVDNNGSGTNGVVTLGGGLSLQDNGWSVTATGANGYSLRFGGTAAATTPNNVGGFTVYNFVPSVAGSGNVEFAQGYTIVNGANNSGVTFAGTGDYLMSGALTGGGSAAGINTFTKSGQGTLTLAASSAATFNGNAGAVGTSVLTLTGGITRVTNAGGLGGVGARVNLSGATLDLRGDAALTTLPVLTVTGTNAYVNVDRAIGGTGTGATHSLGGVSLGAFTLYATGGGNSGAAAYGLNTGTLTMTGTNTVVNSIGNGGALTIPSIAGTQATTFSGAGATVVTGAAASAVGTIAKTGTGTLTFQQPAAGPNATGNLTVNGGTLVADYGPGAANAVFT